MDNYFALLLVITSTLTSLITEAVKAVLDEHSYTYACNTLAGLIAIIVGAVVGVAFGGGLLKIIALIVLSWLCAMLGYDKVMQALGQIDTDEED